MTPRAFVLLLLAGATLFAAANVGVGWLYALGFLFVSYLVVSYLLAAVAVTSLRVTLRPGTVTQAGESLACSVTVENGGRSARHYLSMVAPPLGERLPAWMVFFRGRLIPEDWGFVLMPALPGSGRAIATLQVPAPRRGVHRLPDLLLQAPAYGLGAVHRRIRTDQSVLVRPRVVALPELPWFRTAPGGDRSETRLIPTATGELVRGVREYRTGDGLKSIHWRSTAKTGELRVKESEGERPVGAILVGLDLGPGHDPDTLEQAITVAASLCAYGDRRGIPIQLRSQAGAPADLALDTQLDWLARLSGPADHALVLEGAAVMIAPRPVAVERAIVRLYVGEEAAPAGMIACPAGADLVAVLGAVRRGG